MTWITESPTAIYITLAFVAAILLAVFFNTRRGMFLVLTGVVGLLAGGVWLTDYLVVTDLEQVEMNARGLADAADEGDVNRFGQYISADFFKNGMNRAQLLVLMKQFLPPDPTRRIRASGLEIKPAQRPGELTCTCTITAWGNFPGYPPASGDTVQLELTFKKEADGGWRVRHFSVFWRGGELPVPTGGGGTRMPL